MLVGKEINCVLNVKDSEELFEREREELAR